MNVHETNGQGNRSYSIQFSAKVLIIAGWTGRDPENVQYHIDELVAIGVSPPKQIPMFYRVANTLLTTEHTIEAVGPNSSGEAEFCLFNMDGKLYVAVGSDHTDRALETHDIALSKQVCAKPLSHDCWRFDEVENHWDQLILRSFAMTDGIERPYQEGSVANLLHPQDLLSRIGAPFDHGNVLFGGTIPVMGTMTSAEFFRVELYDPVLERTLSCEYKIKVL